MPEVSVVIPTRNRPEPLGRLLRSLNRQTHPLKEVLIIDAGDDPPDDHAFCKDFPELPIHYFHTRPSICFQKNFGIRQAASPYIFLCDDDMELPPDYVSVLMKYFEDHPQAGAVSGLVKEPDACGRFQHQFPLPSFSRLLWHFLFQLPLWTDLRHLRNPKYRRLPYSLLISYYLRRGNHLTLAGWPLLTRFPRPAFRTTIYGLGASIIRRNWLLHSPFDEILDAHGIGDNYGVALGFPGIQPITVVTETHVLHHKSSQNRLPYPQVFMQRIFALHYFMTRNERFNIFNRLFLIWSLVGQLLSQIYRRETLLSKTTLRVIKAILLRKNPYLMWGKSEQK